MEYIIGVDCGGTKTDARAYDLNDLERARGLTGPGNPALGFSAAAENIKEAILQCRRNFKEQGFEGNCRCIYLGVAGIEIGENKNKLENLISETFQCKVVGLHDSELTHAAMLQGEDGIITIAGTGSVSYGQVKGKTGKTGGWGHILGDEGSGYWIALEALKRMTREQDDGKIPSKLSLKIINRFEFVTVDGMKEFIHGADKYAIAAVAKVVAELSEQGDPTATKILDCAALDLAEQTARLHKKLDVVGPITVGISGGVLHNMVRVREQFLSYLKQDLDSVNILTEDISPTKGACYLYRRNRGAE
jgi:N-acetylglucosamine kinase-like BadF-type ATPase